VPLFALPAASLAVTGGALAWFAKLQPLVTMIALTAVAASWAWVVMQTLRSRKKPAAAMLVVMIAATLMLGVALAWPVLEHWVFRMLRAWLERFPTERNGLWPGVLGPAPQIGPATRDFTAADTVMRGSPGQSPGMTRGGWPGMTRGGGRR
jgi:predicted PurR-regulated permease PerM